jgi:hypothetical protein
MAPNHLNMTAVPTQESSIYQIDPRKWIMSNIILISESPTLTYI